MRIYADHGYDFLAHTDHRRYNRTNHLPETGLTVIPGMEIDFGSITEGEPDDGGFRTMHTVVSGPDDETNGYADEAVFTYHDTADQTGFQKHLDEALDSKELLPVYLRLPQAERELKAKQQA